MEKLQNKEFLEKYYYTFVNFYNIFGEINIKDSEFSKELDNDEIFKGEIEKNNLSLNASCNLDTMCLKAVNILYNLINGINIRKHGHSIELELFRSPLPFPFQELLDIKENIISKLKPRKIKLLLIDNKPDKIFEKDENNNYTGYCGKLIECFKNYNLFELFDLIVFVINKDNKEDLIFNDDKIEKVENNKYKFKNIDNHFSKEDLYFDFKKFKTEEDYKKFIYEKIKNADFILLDFFLDSDNIYLAFDFIKDINDIKKQNNDYSTTWYFITSAVYDSVIKYSQSGLLAEHYETAVVNSGDDPTNEKRQIIFLYKLLTFINARLKNFENSEELIKDWLKSGGNSYCNNYNGRENKKCEKFDDCKRFIENITKKFLLEKDEIKEIFKGKEKDIEKLEPLCRLLSNIFYLFEYLTESEWRKIFHQIDLLNNISKNKFSENYIFPCKYIINELKKRAERY